MEYLTEIYVDRQRQAEHHRLAKKALARRKKHPRNPIQVLGQLLRIVTKPKNGVEEEQTPAVSMNAGS